jgi:hypothetical protein
MAELLSVVLNPQIDLQHVGPIPHPLIRRPKAPDLSRDQKRDCGLLHAIGWSYSQIHTKLGFIINQIANACRRRA